MAKFIYTGCRIFAGGIDLTSNANKVDLQGMYEEKETTSFGSSGFKEFIAGLGSATISAEGQWEVGDPTKVDDGMFALHGTVTDWTVTPQTANVGDLAFLLTALDSKYTLLGAVGDVAPWQASGPSSSPLVRGQIMHPPGTARSSTGTGTGEQIGALLATQAMYTNLHLLSDTAVSGTPTLTLSVESSVDNTFASPTTRGTMSAMSTTGTGQSLKIAGAVTDAWWRVKWTIGGGATTPSLLFVASMGIGPA